MSEVQVLPVVTLPQSTTSRILLERARRELSLSDIHDGFYEMEIVPDIFLPAYEVLFFSPERPMQPEEVRETFLRHDADGNTGAFLAWLMMQKRDGSFMTVPKDDQRLWKSHATHTLHAPAFSCINGKRVLRLNELVGGFSSVWSYLGFRLKTAPQHR